MSLDASVREQLPEFLLDAQLHLSDAPFMALVGPSASGKTTFLRCIAGLHRPRLGVIRCNDRVWQDAHRFVPTHRRSVGYVFQEPSLFSHLSVRGNVEFGQRQGANRNSRALFDEVVSLLGIEPLLNRKTDALSGGERQRVAMARTLLTQPLLLLLDEPLASLDVDSRTQIAPYLATVHQRLNIPVLYVTHDFAEVMRLATEVAYMARGKILAHGPINDVITRPELPLSRHEEAGAALDLPVVVADAGHHLMEVALGDTRFSVAQRPVPIGTRVRVYIRARDVTIARRRPESSSVQNLLNARILDIHPEVEPAHRLVRLSAGGLVLLARVTAKTVFDLQLRPDDEIVAQVKSVALTS